MEKQTKVKITNPRILVACRASVDRGVVHGKWIDATLPIDEIQKEIKTVMETSPQGGRYGWVINRYEGFHGVKIERNLESISSIARGIKKRGIAFSEFVKSVYTGSREIVLKEFDRRHVDSVTTFESLAGFSKLNESVRKKFGIKIALFFANLLGPLRYVASGSGAAVKIHGFLRK